MKISLFGKLIILGTAICVTFLTISSAAAAVSTGLSPLDPLMVPTDSKTIAPNSTLWFYFDYAVDSSGKGSSGASTAAASAPTGSGGGRAGSGAKSSSNMQSAVDVAVDANGNKALQFAIYTPGQATTFAHDDPTVTPAGRGTAYYDTLTGALIHDLHWSGGFNSSGRYFVAVANTSSQSISFRLTVTGDAVTLYPATPTPTATPAVTVPVTTTATSTTTIKGKIIFETATGGEIYTVNGDGSDLTRVSHGIDPSWSPDGSQITFARWDGSAPGLYIANADGSNERCIFSAPQIRWPRWSPDGKYIVFSQDKSKSDSRTLWKLGLVDVSTSKLTEPQCSDRCHTPTWETDSTTIVYTDPDAGLMKTSILGGSASLLMGPSGSYYDTTANVVRPITHLAQIQNSETSADGQRIVYAQAAHDRWEVHVVNADGSSSAAVTTFDEVTYYVLGEAVHNVAPAWSPDGKQILFLSNRNGKWEFFVTDASGTKVEQVLKNVTDQVSIKFNYENERIMDWTD